MTLDDDFFYAVRESIQLAVKNNPDNPTEAAEQAVHSILCILDGVTSYFDSPFTVKYQGQTLARNSYIHEAWGNYMKGISE
jgi:hypothetical protein